MHNLRVNPDVEIRDETVVRPMRLRLVEGEADRSRLWKLAIATYPPYAEYQESTARRSQSLLQRGFSEVATKGPIIVSYSPREASCGKLIWSSRVGVGCAALRTRLVLYQIPMIRTRAPIGAVRWT